MFNDAESCYMVIAHCYMPVTQGLALKALGQQQSKSFKCTPNSEAVCWIRSSTFCVICT